MFKCIGFAGSHPCDKFAIRVLQTKLVLSRTAFVRRKIQIFCMKCAYRHEVRNSPQAKPEGAKEVSQCRSYRSFDYVSWTEPCLRQQLWIKLLIACSPEHRELFRF